MTYPCPFSDMHSPKYHQGYGRGFMPEAKAKRGPQHAINLPPIYHSASADDIHEFAKRTFATFPTTSSRPSSYSAPPSPSLPSTSPPSSPPLIPASTPPSPPLIPSPWRAGRGASRGLS